MGRLVAAILAVVALLGACSKGDGDLATSAPSTTAAATPATPTTTNDGAGASAQCDDLSFTPNSEDIANHIVATGLPCPEAEVFVGKVGPLVGATGGPANISVAGFACVRTREDDGTYGLPSSDYECTSGDKKVTFHRT